MNSLFCFYYVVHSEQLLKLILCDEMVSVVNLLKWTANFNYCGEMSAKSLLVDDIYFDCLFYFA